MIRLLVALSFVALAACGGCRDAPDGDGVSPIATSPNATEFFEPVPEASALAEHVGVLLAEYEPLVDEATRTAVQEYAAPFGSPAAFEPLDSAEAYLAVGEAAFMMGSESGATWAFLNAVDLDGDNVLALSQLGFVLGYQKRWNDARPFLLHAHSLDDELHVILENLAFNYESLGEIERCIYYLERAVIVQPDNGHIRHRLAKCYFKAGLDQAGQDALDIAQRLAPYDVDIAETAGEPPGSQMEDDGGGGILGSPGNEADAGKLIEAVGACQTQLLTDYGEHVTPYSGFGGEFDQAENNLDGAVTLNATAARECEVECGRGFPVGGEQDACIAGCLAIECANDSSALSTFRQTILSARSEWSGKYGFVMSGFAGCAWPAYFRLKDRVSRFERDSSNEMIWAKLETAQETRRVTWDDVDERIVLWQAEIIELCTQAEAAINEIDWDTPVYFDPFKDLDVKICSPLSDSLCVKMTNTSVTVTTPIFIGSPVNAEFSIDARTGKFNATLTVPLGSKSAPGGVAEAGANLKLDMEKGIGVQTEGKLGGPLNKNWTWSQDTWAFSGR
jgi:tetratricopeptide (TPR) repeat protein